MQLAKQNLPSLILSSGVTFLYGKVDKASHANGSSTVTLVDGRKIMGSMVLDATGHAHKLIDYDKPFNPGFQGAYGIIAGYCTENLVCNNASCETFGGMAGIWIGPVIII
jgi:hypothetical protein